MRKRQPLNPEATYQYLRSVQTKTCLGDGIAYIAVPMLSIQSQNENLPAYISPRHKAILQRWLLQRPDLRLATEQDCIRSQSENYSREEIEKTRKYQNARYYHPYYAVGDFNSDGYGDFAVVLTARDKSNDNAAMAAFNGPFSTGAIRLAYFQADLVFSGTNLFFGPPRPRPYRLVVGPFSSEGGILIPRGKGYVLAEQVTHKRRKKDMKRYVLGHVCGVVLSLSCSTCPSLSQTQNLALKIGDTAPEIKLKKVLQSPRGTGWGLKG